MNLAARVRPAPRPDLPRRSPKQPKPVRHGLAYVARRVDGAWLLETRPPSGLLGGMLGWPVTSWTEEAVPADAPPVPADWTETGLEARHTFTHFHLRLGIRTAIVPLATEPGRGRFVPPDAFRPADLPTLMRKVFDMADATLRRV